jgi:hypothetical protein
METLKAFLTETPLVQNRPEGLVRIAAYGDLPLPDGRKLRFDSAAAAQVARDFNALHDDPNDIYGLVITSEAGLAHDHPGSFKTLSAGSDGLLARIQWRHGQTAIRDGDTVACEFSVNTATEADGVLQVVARLEAVEIRREKKS